MNDLTAMYARLRTTVQADTSAPRSPDGCQHPRRFHRTDQWADPVTDDPRLEVVTTRTVCTGCDETLGYTRQRQVARR